MRYITLHAGTGEAEIWGSKEDASRAVLGFDNHRIEEKGTHGAWIITRYKEGDSPNGKSASTWRSYQRSKTSALYDMAQGLDNHAIMSEKVARLEGYLTD